MASCLTWNSTETSHWSGPALFYASTIFALVAIISGSQQLWILPRVDLAAAKSDAEKKTRQQLVSFISRLQDDEGGPKTKYVFALQTPIMLLTFSVMAFLAGLCAVVYSPLAANLAWDANAKVSQTVTSKDTRLTSFRLPCFSPLLRLRQAPPLPLLPHLCMPFFDQIRRR